MFVSSLALLGTVQSTLAAANIAQSLEYTEGGQPAWALTSPGVNYHGLAIPFFEKVSFYPESNLGRALLDLRAPQNRICLIIPQGDTYETGKRGEIAQAVRTTEFMLIIATRDLSIDASQLRPTRQSPGILNLKDLAVELLTKESFVIEDRVIWFAPSAGAVVQIDWKDDSDRPLKADMRGRESWHQLFTANAGEQRTEIGRRSL